MILQKSFFTRQLEQKKFICIHLGIQVYLLLTGICCCLVASHLLNVRRSVQDQCHQPAPSPQDGHPSNLTSIQGEGNFMVSAVTLMTFGLIQSIPAILFIIVHILYGYIAKTEIIILHSVVTVVQMVTCTVCVVSVSVLIQRVNALVARSCSSAHSELVYGLPFVVFVLVVSSCLHISIMLLLLAVDLDVFKDASPPKIRLKSHRSPAMFISRAELRELKDPADLLRLHHVLRTRLPSLRSNHPTQPPSPGFINSLAEIPLTPFLVQPGLVRQQNLFFTPDPLAIPTVKITEEAR